MQRGDVFALDRITGEKPIALGEGGKFRRPQSARLLRTKAMPPHERHRAGHGVRAGETELARGGDERGEDFRAIDIVDAARIAFDVARP